MNRARTIDVLIPLGENLGESVQLQRLLNTNPQRAVVETMGLEPTTPCLQSRCSSQLSYVPATFRLRARLPPPQLAQATPS
jgi:hypothetical protein